MLSRVLIAALLCFIAVAAGVFVLQNPEWVQNLLKPAPTGPQPIPEIVNADDWLYKPNEEAFGRLPAGWVEAWWKWAPESIADEDISASQAGPVWFLPDGMNPADPFKSTAFSRSYAVPEGVGLVVPIVNLAIATRQGVNGRRQALETLDRLFAGVDINSLTLDGKLVGDPVRYRVQAGPFSIRGNELINTHLARSSITLGDQGLITTDGIPLIFKPLPPGRHTVRGRFYRKVGTSRWFTDVTYKLTVGTPPDDAPQPPEPTEAPAVPESPEPPPAGPEPTPAAPE
jgi:hypothetical protein